MRIGIVNHVEAVAQFLQRVVGVDPANRVIWIALNGPSALELCAAELPDLILMEIMMPAMDGVEATRRIMATTPCAILIVTATIRVNASRVFQAMGYGALDAVDTPVLGGATIEELARPLLAKIATIARLVGDNRGRRPAARVQPPPPLRHEPLIAIGASAGGPAVLAALLRDLPANFPAAVVIVQHVDEQFAAGMAAWLNEGSALTVRVAIEGDRPTAGQVLIAASADHLTLKTADRVGYTPHPIDYVYRPSVDVFFHSVCRLWRGAVVGVLMTGMGRDGALGLKALRDRGHYTIAQDQATCAVYGMPKAAVAIHAAVDILPAGRIASKLLETMTAFSRAGDSQRSETG